MILEMLTVLLLLTNASPEPPQPAPAPGSSPGEVIQKLGVDIARAHPAGVYLTEVYPGYLAGEAQLSRGDYLYTLNGYIINSVDDIRFVMARANGRVVAYFYRPNLGWFRSRAGFGDDKTKIPTAPATIGPPQDGQAPTIPDRPVDVSEPMKVPEPTGEEAPPAPGDPGAPAPPESASPISPTPP